MFGLLRRFSGESSGNIATLFALLSPLLIAVAAFAVDEASLHLEKRRLQSVADLAAIYAAAEPSNAAERAALSIADAKYPTPLDSVLVQTGRYTADANLSPSQRFKLDAGPANAARVSLQQTGRVYFASVLGFPPPTIGVTATASATPGVAWSIGSRLARLDGGMLNAVLGGLLGTELSLSLLDYQAIAGVDVKLLDFLDALAGEVGLSVGTYSDLLHADVALADIVAALDVASGGNAVLAQLAGPINDSIMVEMARLIVADGLANLAIGTSAAVEAQVNALNLLTAAALIADGERHIKLALGLTLPNVTGIDVSLVVGEPPQTGWFTLSGEGAYLRTAQTRLRIDISLLSDGGVFGLLAIKLPIYVELAPAEAHVSSLTCPPGRPDLAHTIILARPGVLRLAVGETPAAAFLDTRSPLVVKRTALVNVLSGVARVSALADVSMQQSSPQPLYFSAADARNGVVQSVNTTTPVSSLTASLLGNLNLKLEILSINLLGNLLSGVLGIVSGLITPLAGPLDDVLITLFDALGIAVGEVDVRVLGFDCRNAALVQ